MRLASEDIWLVAHDLTALGDAAAFEAARLASGSGAKLILLHVRPLEMVPPYIGNGEETYAEEEAKRGQLKAVGLQLTEQWPNIKVEFEVLAGDPKERILTEAERHRVTHIVVGTSGRKGVSRLVLGSVAESIVHSAKVPVLVVRGL